MIGLFQLIKEILFPRVCAACDSEIDSGLFCPACRRAQLCLTTLPAEEALDGVLFLYLYEGAVKKAFRNIKFAGDRSLPSMLAEETEALWQEPGTLRFLQKWALTGGSRQASHPGEIRLWPTQKECGGLEDTVLWCGIPTDPVRLRQRGFDLPTLLFRNRAAAVGGSWQSLLCRTRQTLPMYGLTPEERRRNLTDCFAPVRDVRGKSVMLTDDIFTTGATFTAAARVLKQAGAKRVTGLAFCGAVENR